MAFYFNFLPLVCCCNNNGNFVQSLFFRRFKNIRIKKTFSKNFNGHLCADLFRLKCFFMVVEKMKKKKRIQNGEEKRIFSCVDVNSDFWWMPSGCTVYSVKVRVKQWTNPWNEWCTQAYLEYHSYHLYLYIFVLNLSLQIISNCDTNKSSTTST